MRARAAALALALAVGACAHGPTPAGEASSGPDAVLTIRSNVADSEVVIDGQVAGQIRRTREHGIVVSISLEPGKHQIELRHDDYFSAYADVELARAEKRPLTLELAPILP